ncbi:MAG: WD repeat-containing protein 82, partial [Paramarteilia canceri]
VSDMVLSPSDDIVISSSLDKTIRIWDLKSPNCQGIVHLPSPALINIDPQGLIFCIGSTNSHLKLYNLKSYDKGPFSTFDIKKFLRNSSFEWKKIKFSPDGTKIGIMTNSNALLMVDSYSGDLLFTFSDFQNQTGEVDFTYTPNGKFCICGSSNRMLHFIGMETGELLFSKSSQHVNITNMLFNPVYALMATAENFINLWLPDLDEQ